MSAPAETPTDSRAGAVPRAGRPTATPGPDATQRADASSRAASRAAATARRWPRPAVALTTVAALAFLVALLRPGFTWPGVAGQTLVVVDITQSMNVADMRRDGRPATRLAYTRDLIGEVIARLPCGHRVGVAAFTERKTTLLIAPIEVCAHAAALRDTLAALDTRMAWAADSHLYYGLYSALDEIERRHPGTAVAFFSDGHQAPALFPGREPRYERHAGTPPGLLFGVGGSLPQPVPKLDADGRVAGYWTQDEAASFASAGAPTLSVVDMERMAAGQDVRNAPQRPAGADAEHLSQRRDAVLEALASITGLGVQTLTGEAGEARRVADALGALPGTHRVERRVELHDGLVAAGALLLLAAQRPRPWRPSWRRRSARTTASRPSPHTARS